MKDGVEGYDPKTVELLSFNRAVPAFLDGRDSPRAFLERCLETIEAREPDVRAFVTLNAEGARKAADAANERYKAGRALSCVDGMPVAIKDVFDTEDMPTRMGSPIFDDAKPGYDAASVFWLRRGGAVILGKTVTTEFAFGRPGPTRNPWDSARTPGGSSSGTAAAVGAGMVPVGTGSQVRGSVMRPAAFCGTYALKPSYGAINIQGGFPSPPSIAHLGVLGGTLTDTWRTAHYISNAAGGDPGHRGLGGGSALPAERKPARLARLDTAGWAATPEETRAVFERLLADIAAKGVEIVDRRGTPEIEALEQQLVGLTPVIMEVLTWEGRYPLALYAARYPDKLGEAVAARVKASEQMTRAQYEIALDYLAELRRRFEALRGRVDGCIALTATGAAPEGLAVGDPVYGDVSSGLLAPAFNLPMLTIEGMPLGAQVIGFRGTDYDLAGLAHWITHNFIRRVRPAEG
ncbi:MAG: amidase [Alphaproteobacteria bacterium]